MPWTVGDVDKHRKGLTPAQKSKWVSIANGVLKDCQSKGGSGCDAKAIRIANSKFDLVDINSTWTFADLDDHDEFFGLKKDTEKKGGSNAGKYKTKGPFCGPSGGAPKGTYPVNTKGRAVAAISYARHAPNPSGIKSCVCRHWPGLAACKKKEKQSMADNMVVEKIPKGALRFVEEGCHAFADISEGEEKIPKLKMTAYNGKIIKGHWYWGDLAIDLNGMSFPSGKFPILENHNTDRKVGFHKGKPDMSNNSLELIPEKTQFVSTDAADEFIKLSSEGFPYQASIYAKPTEIQRLMKDETAEVNGFTFRGPGTVWRKSQFKEASVCVFGWDSQTNASAFSKTETEDVEFLEDKALEDCCQETEQNQFKEGGEIMNLEELKEKHPDLVTLLTEEVTTNVTEQLTIIFGEEKKLLEDENARLSGEVDARDERLSKLEKKDALRDEKDRKETADKIWANKLSDSGIDEHMWPKVQNMVSYKKFVKDDDLDVEAFTAAVDAEIKDWESRLSTVSNTTGMGFVNRSAEGGGNESKDQLKEENTGLTNSLLKRAGQKVE